MKYYSTLGEALGDSIEIPGTVVPSLTVNYPTAPTPQAPATPTDSSGPPSEATKELVGQTYPYPEPVICNQFEFIPEKPNYFLKPGQPGGPAAESEISINNQKCRETRMQDRISKNGRPFKKSRHHRTGNGLDQRRAADEENVEKSYTAPQ